MNIRHLKYFISVAEHLNFTKAAEEFYIAQPAMSQLISGMEKELDTQLFIRNKRSVQLTKAGEVFLEEARGIVERYDQAVQKLQEADGMKASSLRVAYWGPYEQLFLPTLLERFGATHPEVTLTLFQRTLRDLTEELENGLIDVAFSSPYSFQNKQVFHQRILGTSPACAVFHWGHPLSNTATLPPSFLGREKMLIMDMHGSKDFTVFMDACKRNGFTPTIIGQSPHYENLLLMAQSGIGTALLPQSLAERCPPQLRFIRLEGDITASVAVSWLKSNTNPSIPMLLKLIEATMPPPVEVPSAKKRASAAKK